MKTKITLTLVAATLLAACGGKPVTPSSSAISARPSEAGSASSSSSVATPSSEGSSASPSSHSEVPVRFAIVAEEAEGASIIELSATSAKEGDEITFKVKVEEGYRLDAVRVNQEKIEPNDKGVYSFTMGKEEARITLEAKKVYLVSLVANQATLAFYFNKSDHYAENETVRLSLSSIEDGYRLSSVSVKDASENSIPVSSDSGMLDGVTFYSFSMPAGPVTVTPIVAEIDPELASIAATYRGSNIASKQKNDKPTLKLSNDGTASLSEPGDGITYDGTYTYDSSAKTATGSLKSSNAGVSYTLSASFREDGSIYALLEEREGSYRTKEPYLFAKGGVTSLAKYYTAKSMGHPNVLTSYQIGTNHFFTYVSEDFSVIELGLRAKLSSTGEEATTLTSGSIYSLYDKSGEEKHVVKANGSLIRFASSERGTYTSADGDNLILDGFGSYTLGEESGTYVYHADASQVVCTANGTSKAYNLDLTNKTYAVGEVDNSTPFEGLTYEGSFILISQGDYGGQTGVVTTIAFSAEEKTATLKTTFTNSNFWGASNETEQNYANQAYTYAKDATGAYQITFTRSNSTYIAEVSSDLSSMTFKSGKLYFGYYGQDESDITLSKKSA